MASNFLLVHVFTAFLPPRPDRATEGDFYDDLGLTNSTTTTVEEIRKAYKQKSLQLHPDKVAQRGQDVETAKAQYERVQEAYACLHDAKSRQRYHQLKCSPTWYRFVYTSGGFHHPVAIYENLHQAKFVDKTRIVLLVTFFALLVVLQPILVAAKVNQYLDPSSSNNALVDTPWTVILIPLWIVHGLVVLALASLTILVRSSGSSIALALSFLEATCWLIGEVLLAVQWDDAAALRPQSNWHAVSIPFYLALSFRIANAVVVVSHLLKQQMKMISPEKLRADHPDWTDEQFLAAEDEYVIVTVDEEAVENAVQLLSLNNNNSATANPTEEEMEALRVQLSPEFQAVSAMMKGQSVSVLHVLLFGFTFVALVASKLQNPNFGGSWWAVFVPIWLYLGKTILRFFFVCCCLSTGETVVMVRDDDGEEGQESNKDDNSNDQEGDVEAGAGEKKNKNKNKTDNDVREEASSDFFAAAEGSMREFNEKKQQKPQQPQQQTSASAATAAASTKTETGTGPPPQETQETRATDESSAESRPSDEEEGNDRGDTNIKATKPDGDDSSENIHMEDVDLDDDDNAMPHLDEETFRAWQKAQEKAEASAMEQQARACSSCCLALFQLMIVCLIVGKLQQDYESPDPNGYSAFWVLFPIFLVMAILLCCCSCLIYTSGGSSLDGLVERAKHQQEQEQEQQQQGDEANNPQQAREDEEHPPELRPPATAPAADSNTVVIPAPDTAAAKVDDEADSKTKDGAAAAATTQDVETGSVGVGVGAAPDPPEVIDMNDLD